MIVLGITGSIGSGKSHFCKILAKERGVRLLSSDAEVHRLYAEDKELFKRISMRFPEAIVAGKIDRKILGEIVFKDYDDRKELEEIVYPLLAKDRERFIRRAIKDKAKMVILEVPLLFENELDALCDYTVTLYCSPSLAKTRVMRRKGMTEAKYKNILAAQMPTSEKILLSDYYFNTGRSKEFIARAAKKLYLKLIKN